MGFLNKRHALFRDQCAKKRFTKSPQADQHKIFRDLIAQISIVCGVIGAPQTAFFKNQGSIFALKSVFTKAFDPAPTPKFASLADGSEESPLPQNTLPKYPLITQSVTTSFNAPTLGTLKSSKGVQTLRQTTEAEQSLNGLLAQCSQLQQQLAARV